MKNDRNLGKNNRRKGHDAERYYATLFKELGFEFCVTARVGSRLYDNAKIDLINLPFNVQIKAGLQKSMNPGRELFNMKSMIKALFPPEDAVHTRACFLIHKKSTGKGNKSLPEHQIVYMSKQQYDKYKEEVPHLEYLFDKEFKFQMQSEFKHVVALTCDEFIEKIIKKKYLDGSLQNTEGDS